LENKRYAIVLILCVIIILYLLDGFMCFSANRRIEQIHHDTCSNVRKARNPTTPASTPTPETPANPGDVLVIDTTHHTEECDCPRYDEIYKTFNIGYFSLEMRPRSISKYLEKWYSPRGFSSKYSPTMMHLNGVSNNLT
jgi:hypothetical protein